MDKSIIQIGCQDLIDKSYEILEEFCQRIESLQEKSAAVLIQLRFPQYIRFAIEFRNRQWMVEWTFRELRKTGWRDVWLTEIGFGGK